MEPIADRINALREVQGISESRLADDSRIPRSTFKRRLLDPTTFTLAELERVAERLDTTPGELWREAVA